MLTRTHLFVLFVIPVVSALMLGFWLSARIQTEAHLEVERLQTVEVLAQDRLLIDALQSAVDSLKVQALGLMDARQVAGASAVLPAGAILHWAELSFEPGALPSVRQTARRAGWGDEGFEKVYLDAAIAQLNQQELQKNGVTILRVRQDPQSRSEWLALGFEGRAPGRVLLVLVDPAQAFAVFSRWAPRSEGGRLRGYLIGTDGMVIAHSEPSYIASDFSATQVFREGIALMFQGRIVRGAGVYRGIDQVPLNVAYARLGSLPLGVVVERVQLLEAPVLARTSWMVVGAGLGGLILFCMGATVWIRRQIGGGAVESLQAAQGSLLAHRAMAEQSRDALLNAKEELIQKDQAWRPDQDYESVRTSYENENLHS